MKRPFYLIRHGQSMANAGGYPAGQMDSRLTPAGREQARVAAAILPACFPAPDYMVASTLSRARDTAVILNQPLNLPLIHDRRLGEQHYGRHQGRRKAGIVAQHGEDWSAAPPGGESFAAFQDRVCGRIMHWLQRRRGVPAFVCHGGVMKAACLRWAGFHPGPVENCAVYLFEPPQNRRAAGLWRVSRLILTPQSLIMKKLSCIEGMKGSSHDQTA